MKSFLKPALLGLTFLPAALGAQTASDSALLQWAPAYQIPAMQWNLGPPRDPAHGRLHFIHLGAVGNDLSRAMAKQSFSSEAINSTLPVQTVTHLVDRDEQPEWAAYAQAFLLTHKQGGGWPANLWITPLLRPVEGAAYLPPSQEWGGEGFRNVQDRAFSMWDQSNDDCEVVASDLLAQMTAPREAPVAITPAALEEKLAAGEAAWLAAFDAANGGFGEAPRYAEPETLRFLVRRSDAARQAAVATLDKLAANGLRSADGAVYRRAADVAFTQPVKLIFVADQARLALAYLDAATVTGEARFTAEAVRLLTYAATQLQRPDGAFRRGIDATETDGAPVYIDERAFADDNGLVLHALLSVPDAARTPALKKATEALTRYLTGEAEARGGLVHRSGSSVAATLQDSVWVHSALTRSGRANARGSFSTTLTDHHDRVAHHLRVMPLYRITFPWALPPVPPAPGEGPSAEAAIVLAAQAAALPVPDDLRTLCLDALTHDASLLPRGDLLLAGQLASKP